MAGEIRIGEVAFVPGPVPAMTASAVLGDSSLQQVLRRVVWTWRDGAGKFHGPTTAEGAVPLSSALVFHVSVPLPGGAVGGDPAASARMAKRFLQATGAASLGEAVKAVTTLVQLPMKVVPLEAFAAMRSSGDFDVVQDTDYCVVSLSNRKADLLAYLCLPNRVRYWHRPPGDESRAPGERGPQPTAVVPARTPAARALRMMALDQRRRDLAQALKTLPEGAGGETARENLRAAGARIEEERRQIGGDQARIN